MDRKWIALCVIVVLTAAGGYLGSPYWAVHRFKEAAISANVDKLDAAVDFPAVRESLKSQMSAAMMREMNDDPAMKNNPFAGLGMVMMPAIIDKMVDTFVTPDGMAALVRGSKPVDAKKTVSAADPDVDYSYEYVSLDRFRVKLFNRKSKEKGPSLVFERRGFISWKLIRVEIPDDFLKGQRQAAAASEGPILPVLPTEPASEPVSEPSDDQLKSQWMAQNEECRGGQHSPDDTVCQGRDETERTLEGRRICWGYSDVSVLPTEYGWHPCSQARPLETVE